MEFQVIIMKMNCFCGNLGGRILWRNCWFRNGKLIMSFNTEKHSEIQPIYHVDPEEELLMTFKDDSMEEIPTSAIAKTSTAKGNGKYSAQ